MWYNILPFLIDIILNFLFFLYIYVLLNMYLFDGSRLKGDMMLICRYGYISICFVLAGLCELLLYKSEKKRVYE